MKPEVGFQWVGERCNPMDSARFKKLVDTHKWDEAMEARLAQFFEAALPVQVRRSWR